MNAREEMIRKKLALRAATFSRLPREMVGVQSALVGREKGLALKHLYMYNSTSRRALTMNGLKKPTLYVADDSDSHRAVRILKEAGFDPVVRSATSYDAEVCRIPMLFGVGGKFDGIDGIRLFIQNAHQLLKSAQG